MDREDRLKIGICAAVLAADSAGIAALGLGFDWASVAKLMLLWPALLALGWFYAAKRPDPSISHLLRETGHMLFFSAAAAMLSYLATAADRPLIDEALIAADRLMGFDWKHYVAFVNARPWLGDLSSALYVSTLPQVALATVLLPVLGQSARGREFVLAIMLAALICIGISAVLPSAGALAFFKPDPAFYMANQPVVDMAYKDEFFRMRTLAIHTLSLQDAKGLIAFPSYHVSMSVLIALAFRGMPRFFWPLLALNLGVILSTPIDGGHHLVDGVAGAAVALLALWLAGLLRAQVARAPLSPAPAVEALPSAR
jgi:membrane-associated phospholipid phosphatase